MDEQNELETKPQRLRESAWELFRRAADLRLEADELAKRAAELLKLAAEKDSAAVVDQAKARSRFRRSSADRRRRPRWERLQSGGFRPRTEMRILIARIVYSFRPFGLRNG